MFFAYAAFYHCCRVFQLLHHHNRVQGRVKMEGRVLGELLSELGRWGGLRGKKMRENKREIEPQNEGFKWGPLGSNCLMENHQIISMIWVELVSLEQIETTQTKRRRCNTTLDGLWVRSGSKTTRL